MATTIKITLRVEVEVDVAKWAESNDCEPHEVEADALAYLPELLLAEGVSGSKRYGTITEASASDAKVVSRTHRPT